MRTVLRIAQDKDGSFEGWNLTNEMEAQDIYKLLGMLDVLKNNIIRGINCEEIDQKESDDIRKLLD